MFQLSGVDGGATGFPILGKAILPRRGSVALWYNLKRNGNKDLRSLHGACPTIFGIKWGKLRDHPQFMGFSEPLPHFRIIC